MTIATAPTRNGVVRARHIHRSTQREFPRHTAAFDHDALEVFLDPALCEHPDFHDGWGEPRLREVPLRQTHMHEQLERAKKGRTLSLAHEEHGS